MFYYHLVQFEATQGLYSRLRLVWIAQNSNLCFVFALDLDRKSYFGVGIFFNFFLPLKDALMPFYYRKQTSL